MPYTPLDTRPLTQSGGWREVRRFASKNLEYRFPRFFPTGIILIVTVISTFLWAQAAIFIAPMDPVQSAVIWVCLGVGLTALIVTAVWINHRRKLRAFRIKNFADANGMEYRGRHHQPFKPGLIFEPGIDREASNLVRFGDRRPIEVGNYVYAVDGGKAKVYFEWSYVEIRLNNSLPHIVLDAKGGSAIPLHSKLPINFKKEQRLGLEGDFDDYFTLYCPTGYEQDALYLFTPDIMARFIDNSAHLDVEIVDRYLYLYSKSDLSTDDPEMWEWLMSVIEALTEKLDRWERWRDDRLNPALGTESEHEHEHELGTGTPLRRPPKGVAQPGKRLRRPYPWLAAGIGALVIGFWITRAIVGG